MSYQNDVDGAGIICWKHPFTALVAGPTGCGKTAFVLQLLEGSLIDSNSIIQPVPQKVYWFYGQYQPAYNKLQHASAIITFIQDLPDDLLQYTGKDPAIKKVVVLDDLMASAAKGKQVTNMFVQGSHHLGISVIYIVQNLFFQGPEMRTISLNAHYIVLFKNPREQSQVAFLGRQMYGPGRGKVMVEAFKDATKKAYGYLVVNLKPDTDDRFRLMTNIFAPELPVVVYLPK